MIQLTAEELDAIRSRADALTDRPFTTYSGFDVYEASVVDIRALLAEVDRLRAAVVVSVDPEAFELHTGGDEQPHYRVYETEHDELTVVCVQDFDYPDYRSGFVTATRHATEASAERDLALYRARG
jgi:hypothetical protein